MPDLSLRPARPDEASFLTDLALRSKGHWGYDAAFLAACRDELTVQPELCDGAHLHVAECDGQVIGYYQITGVPPVGELADLFVDPRAIGTGIGAALLRHARQQAHDLGFDLLSIDADPHAEAFYVHAGARRVGVTASGSISGRVLPRLELRIDRPSW